MMRLWHLVFGLLVVFTAAHIYFGIPGGIAGLLRWPLLFGVAGLCAWTVAFAAKPIAPLHGAALPSIAAMGVLMSVYVITAVAGYAVELSGLKLLLVAAQAFIFVYAGQRLFTLPEWHAMARYFFFLLAAITALLFIGGLTGWSPLRTNWDTYHQGRLALLANPNSNAMVALVTGTIALWALYWPVFQGRWQRVAPLLVLAMAGLVLLWTASRTSQLAFAVAIGIWAVTSRQNLYLLCGLALAGGILWLWRADASAAGVMDSLFSRWQGDVLLVSRGGVWEASLENWRAHPWFGQGFGVTEGGFEGQSLLESVGSVRDGSGYFGVLESIGVVGVAALLLLYGTVARNLIALAQATASWRSTAAWVLGMMGGTLFFALTVNLAGEPWLLGPGAFPHITFIFALGLHTAGYAAYRQAVARELVDGGAEPPAPRRLSRST